MTTKQKNILVWVIIAVLVIAAFIAAYFAFKTPKSSTTLPDFTNTNPTTPAPQTTPQTGSGSGSGSNGGLDYNRSLNRGVSATNEVKKLQGYLNLAMLQYGDTYKWPFYATKIGAPALANSSYNNGTSTIKIFENGVLKATPLTLDGDFGPKTEGILKAFTGRTYTTLAQAADDLLIPNNKR